MYSCWIMITESSVWSFHVFVLDNGCQDLKGNKYGWWGGKRRGCARDWDVFQYYFLLSHFCRHVQRVWHLYKVGWCPRPAMMRSSVPLMLVCSHWLGLQCCTVFDIYIHSWHQRINTSKSKLACLVFFICQICWRHVSSGLGCPFFPTSWDFGSVQCLFQSLE